MNVDEVEGPALLVVGELRSEWEFIGPFDDPEAAIDYADRHHRATTWWITHLTTPEEES